MPNWKKVIVSGSDAELNSLNVTSALTASGNIYPTTLGDDGQIIMTDGAGNLSFEDNIKYVVVKNISGGTLYKGTPVHATASSNPPSGNLNEVIAASSSNAASMPATFVLNEDLENEEEGKAILTGFIQGIDTTGLEEGQIVYVGENGGWTGIKPQGDSNLIQNLGIVTKVHPTNGSGYVYGSGRSNDVPNLTKNKIWVGSDTYTVTSSILTLDEENSIAEVTGSINISSAITASTAQFNSLPSNPTETTILVVDDSGNVATQEISYDKGGGYVHTQTTPSTTWTIPHNLNTRPLNVDIVDSNYNLIIVEDVSFPTVDTAVISFPSPQAGAAIFSSVSASYTQSLADLQIVTDNGNTTTTNIIVSSSGTTTIADGTITASGDIEANNFITTSDKKLKSQITEIGSGLEVLKQFTAYEYVKDNKQDAGFIAQEVQEVLPYAVFTGSDEYLTMNDRPILAHMHKAILELEERIKAIENKL